MTRGAGAPDADWVIVGGGIHGVHVALRLLVEGGVDRERLVIVDPAERLLARWRACTDVTGMAYLRSPVVHHLGPDGYCLQRFAEERPELALFTPPYNRPSLRLFDAHCDHLIETFGLEELHHRGRVLECSVTEDRGRLRLLGGGQFTARRIVLALGTSEEPHWPAWVPRGDPRVQHVFARDFDGWPRDGDERLAVVGGGISAVQVAIRLAAEGNRVRILCRHPLREHQFDSEPGWLGPKFMTGFQRTRDYRVRRATIARARHRGSLPPDVHRALKLRQARGEIRVDRAEVEALELRSADVRVRLSTGNVMDVDRVLLASGFTPKRPGGRLIDELIRSAELPCAPCGYPVLDSALRWHPRVHVTGALADLELGPVSRNIAGARRAADRILSSLPKAKTEQRLQASAR